VRVQNGVLSSAGCIVGLDLDRTVALVRLPRRKSQDPSVIMEQLTGWLCARGRRVIRIRGCGPRQRILLRIQRPAQVRSIVVYWCRNHLADLELRTGVDLPKHVLVESAIRDVWRKATEFWEETIILLQALQHIDPQILLDVSYILANVAKTWEYRCARLERRATSEAWIEPEDRELVAKCDRHLKQCLRFVPCYRMITHTTCRLL
jgi:hypothetical protein